MALLKAVMPKLNTNPEGGAFIITSSIAVSLSRRRSLTELSILAGRLTGRVVHGILSNESCTVAFNEMRCRKSRVESADERSFAWVVDD